MKFQGKRPVIEVPLIPQNPGFHSNVAAFHRGPGTQIGDGGVDFPIYVTGADVDAEFGDDQFSGQGQIGGGNAQGTPQGFPVDHRAGENMRMP